MRATEMRKKLINIIYDRYRYDGNTWVEDQRAEQEHAGQVRVCDDLLSMLGMTWGEVEALYKKQNKI